MHNIKINITDNDIVGEIIALHADSSNVSNDVYAVTAVKLPFVLHSRVIQLHPVNQITVKFKTCFIEVKNSQRTKATFKIQMF